MIPCSYREGDEASYFAILEESGGDAADVGPSGALGCIPFFSSYGVLIVHIGKIVGCLSLNLNPWL